MYQLEDRKIVICLDNRSNAKELFNLFLNNIGFFSVVNSLEEILQLLTKVNSMPIKFNLDLIILDNPDFIIAVRKVVSRTPIIILGDVKLPPSITTQGETYYFKFTSSKEDWKNIFTYLWDKNNRPAVIPYLQQLQVLNLS